MLPLYDDQPTSRVPAVTVLLIIINAIVFVGWQLRIGLQESVVIGAMVPSEFTQSPSPADVKNMISSMFMHGGWAHLIGNMWFLWIFGNNIEDACGHVRFLLSYLLCGFVADFAHIAAAPNSMVPMIGASGAVSGVLGAYLILHPKAKVTAFVPLGIVARVMQVPAFLFLVLWIGLQVFSQVASIGLPEGGGVAYLAHIGGFVAGLALIFLFRKRQKQTR